MTSTKEFVIPQAFMEVLDELSVRYNECDFISYIYKDPRSALQMLLEFQRALSRGSAYLLETSKEWATVIFTDEEVIEQFVERMFAELSGMVEVKISLPDGPRAGQSFTFIAPPAL